MIEIIYVGASGSQHYFDTYNSLADLVAAERAIHPSDPHPIIFRTPGMEVELRDGRLSRCEPPVRLAW
jgi:hypothetical protein